MRATCLVVCAALEVRYKLRKPPDHRRRRQPVHNFSNVNTLSLALSLVRSRFSLSLSRSLFLTVSLSIPPSLSLSLSLSECLACDSLGPMRASARLWSFQGQAGQACEGSAAAPSRSRLAQQPADASHTPFVCVCVCVCVCVT
jgi:hypothetical protein